MCLPLLGVGAAAAGAAGGAMGGIGTIMGVAQMGLGIMGAMASHSAQMAEYNEQVRFRMEQAKQQQKTLNQQVAQQTAAYNSELDKAQGEKAETAIQAYKAVSAQKTRTLGAGIDAGGMTFQHLIADIYGEQGRFNNRVDYNAKVATQNTENQLKMAQRGAQAEVASIPIPTKPSFAPTLVSIGSSIVSGIGTIHKYSPSTQTA